jgi:hypothetical protein
MSKDRYSDDHIIEVVGDTKTVSIKDNLSVDQDISAGNDLTVGNDLNVSGGLNITGNLNINGSAGDFTAGNITVTGDFLYDSPITLMRPVPITYIKESAALTKNPSPTTICTLFEPDVSGYICLHVGQPTPYTTPWSFSFPVDDYMLNDATITGIYFLVENSDSSTYTNSTYDLDIDLYTFNAAGAGTSSSSIDSDTITLVTAQSRQWLKAEFNSMTSLNPDPLGNCFYVKFSKSSSETITVYIYKCILEYTIDNLKSAINRFS